MRTVIVAGLAAAVIAVATAATPVSSYPADPTWPSPPDWGSYPAEPTWPSPPDWGTWPVESTWGTQ